MSFYLKHVCHLSLCFAARVNWTEKRARARRFKSKESAFSLRGERGSSSHEVVEITFGLRWYSEGKPKALSEFCGYYVRSPNGSLLGHTSKQKDATRFSTPAEARAELERSCLRDGVLGPADVNGYRVVRFTKKAGS
jgi:hypothetical protein